MKIAPCQYLTLRDWILVGDACGANVLTKFDLPEKALVCGENESTRSTKNGILAHHDDEVVDEAAATNSVRLKVSA